jgi:hypothetical protein
MTPSNTIEELVGQVEAATEGSRELDSAVFAACGMHINPHPGSFEYGRWPDETERRECYYRISPVTASVDAALALAERLHGVHWYSILLDAVREFGASGVKPPADLPRYIILATLRSLRIKGDHNDEA